MNDDSVVLKTTKNTLYNISSLSTSTNCTRLLMESGQSGVVPGRVCVVFPFIAGVRGGMGVHITRVRDARTVQSLSLKAKITA